MSGHCTIIVCHMHDGLSVDTAGQSLPQARLHGTVMHDSRLELITGTLPNGYFKNSVVRITPQVHIQAFIISITAADLYLYGVTARGAR